ncbi:hypothetical protein BS614_02675 [Paenibacillus xylanexedens]|uniref:hypothetical protein n=1 Tax=Paenibacillus xylanexedens TaxID=528191 RepID=UPI000938860D|nr:hypothetical protein [Paenibacillus xylanexedens]APO43074.1 hypothetical protein BS614_02675 [Paenibacillus xylanexedens]
MRKGLSMILFTLFIAAAIIYPMVENKNKAIEQTIEPFDYDEWLATQDEVVEAKLPFEAEIPIFYMEELNLGGLSSQYQGSVVSEQTSFNSDTKALYFYSDLYLPTEDTQFLVLSKTYAMDILLEDNVYNMNQKGDFKVAPIELETSDMPNPIRNEQRLLLNAIYEVKLADNGVDMIVNWSYGEQTKQIILQPGQTEVINREDKGLRSRMLFINYGKWNTSNMTYVENTPI